MAELITLYWEMKIFNPSCEASRSLTASIINLTNDIYLKNVCLYLMYKRRGHIGSRYYVRGPRGRRGAARVRPWVALAVFTLVSLFSALTVPIRFGTEEYCSVTQQLYVPGRLQSPGLLGDAGGS